MLLPRGSLEVESAPRPPEGLNRRVVQLVLGPLLGRGQLLGLGPALKVSLVVLLYHWGAVVLQELC